MSSAQKVKAQRSVLQKPEKLVTCRLCGNAWPKNRYYNTCYRGIDCPTFVSGANPSNLQSQEEPPLKVSKLTDRSTALLSILDDQKDVQVSRKAPCQVPAAGSHEEQPLPVKLMHSKTSEQVAIHLQAGAESSKTAKSDKVDAARSSRITSCKDDRQESMPSSIVL
jgi:hypothetical protein